MADDGLPTMCCCECGVGIDPVLNPSNTCVSCIRARVDITDGISTSLSVFRCRRCERFCSGTTSWVEAAQESQELLALCMKRIKGLKRVKVADAAWVWTEPHSMRLKIKLCIQKEIYNGAVIQQPLLVEFVVKNQQCPDCAAAFASMAWTASVQVRQRVDHKRTFFYLEQVILKKNAQQACIKIEQFRDGLDFFFKEKNDAMRFVTFLEDAVPTKVKNSKKLVAMEQHSNLFFHQYTAFVQVAAACKDDLILLEGKLAARLGDMPRVSLVKSVNAVARLVDPQTGKQAELLADRYWRQEPVVMMSARQLTTFVVLDVEAVARRERPASAAAQLPVDGKEEPQQPVSKKRRRERASNNPAARVRGFVAEVVVARLADLGVNDVRTTIMTHLGALLRAGDEVLGYDLRTANLSAAASIDKLPHAPPEIVLVRKAPRNKARDAEEASAASADQSKAQRNWELRDFEADEVHEDNCTDNQRDADYETFLQQLETDKEMRSHVNLYHKPAAKTATAQDDDNDNEDDVEADPDALQLGELLDLTIKDDVVA